jgi:hypothetical protein
LKKMRLRVVLQNEFMFDKKIGKQDGFNKLDMGS